MGTSGVEFIISGKMMNESFTTKTGRPRRVMANSILGFVVLVVFVVEVLLRYPCFCSQRL
jgi:hypothetical protein